MKHTLTKALVWILGIVSCIAVVSCSRSPEPKYYWVMSGSCPDSGVRIWYPAELPDHKDCEETNVSPALALAIVLNMTQDVNQHKIHFHIRQDDNRGLVLTEYLADPQSKSGEHRLGRDEIIHYHGVYVDLSAAKELIVAVKAHQHGAE
jgi:hypothetical protein